MSVVGRFEILSPVFSGALDTSTARDPQTGETVLLHLLPAGHEQSPREFFLEIASHCPGKILDSGIDAETKRAFVVTDYPKDRKTVRLWIRELSGLTLPEKPAAPVVVPAPPTASVPAREPLRPEAPPDTAPNQMFDPAAVFAAAYSSSPPSAPSEPPAAAGTRMFDPSAVFGHSAAAASKEAPKPAQDGATRMFDPSAVFGAAVPAPRPVAAPPQKPKEAAASHSDGATRIFDPSALFDSPAPAHASPAKPTPLPAPDSGTRMFDPSAVFGAPAPPKPKPTAPPASSSDSSRKAAEEFIHGRLPAEFRYAPTSVQRSLEELLGKKPQGPDVPPTPGRPGVITLLFDAYGKRIEQTEEAQPDTPSDKGVPPAAEEAADFGATKMLSSSDLSAYFGPNPATPEKQDSHPKPNDPSRK